MLEQAKRLAINVSEGASSSPAEPGDWSRSDAPPAPEQPVELPFPIAYTDVRVEGEASPVMRVKRRIDGFEHTLCFLVCATLGYLQPEGGTLPTKVVDLVAQYTGRPVSMGAWLELLYKLAGMLHPADEHPIAQSVRPFSDEGKPSALAKRIELLIQFRNKLAHSGAPAEEAIQIVPSRDLPPPERAFVQNSPT